jgi:hypothetical protein
MTTPTKQLFNRLRLADSHNAFYPDLEAHEDFGVEQRSSRQNEFENQLIPEHGDQILVDRANQGASDVEME